MVPIAYYKILHDTYTKDGRVFVYRQTFHPFAVLLCVEIKKKTIIKC